MMNVHVICRRVFVSEVFAHTVMIKLTNGCKSPHQRKNSKTVAVYHFCCMKTAIISFQSHTHAYLMLNSSYIAVYPCVFPTFFMTDLINNIWHISKTHTTEHQFLIHDMKLICSLHLCNVNLYTKDNGFHLCFWNLCVNVRT